MFSIPAYRAAEDRAIAARPELAEMHLQHFPRGGRPWNYAEEVSELRPLINAMHEDRFDRFMSEIGGFTRDERKAFVAVLAENMSFQRAAFPHDEAIAPIDQMMAQFVVAKKIRALKPGVKRVLEIGPGSGFLSFFLRDLEMFAQIEAAGSFYALQSTINVFLFGSEFMDLAEHSAASQASSRAARCKHYPWWKADDLIGEHFDVITANANWNEMTTDARRYYLALCQRALKPDGMIVSQCLGGNCTGVDWGAARDLVWNDFISAGFRPAFFVNRGYDGGEGLHSKKILPVPLGQAVLVPNTHPWWDHSAVEPADYACIDAPEILRAYHHSVFARFWKTYPSRAQLESDAASLARQTAA